LEGTILVASKPPVDPRSSVDTTKTATNDVLITNLPTEYCSISKLAKYFCNKKKSGISSFKRVDIVNQNTAILCLLDEEGTVILCMYK